MNFLVLLLLSILLVSVFSRDSTTKSKKTESKEETISDAELGLRELQKTLKDPKALAEAMEMLKDPEIAKEVRLQYLYYY